MPPQSTRNAVHLALLAVAVGALVYFGGQPGFGDRVIAAASCWCTWLIVVGSIGALVGVHLLVDNWSALFGKVEEGLAHHGGQLVADVLAAHGVKFVFTLVGGHISPILVSSKDAGIRVIDVRHEVTAVFAADAVARLTGVPGVAAVTAGPGLTNTITAVKNAQMAESPVVLIGGAAATLAKGRGALQDIDQMAVLKPLVKYAATCNTVRDIVPIMRKAFQEAASGTPGPVFVEFPIDVLYPVMEVRANLALTKRMRKEQIDPKDAATMAKIIIPAEAKGQTQAEYLESRSDDEPLFLNEKPKVGGVVKMYLEFCLRRIFADGFNVKRDVSPLPVSVPMPSKSQVNQALNILRNAKHPVFLIASQATLSPKNCDALAEAAHRLGAPCFLGGMARGLLGRNSQFHIRQNRRGALKQADAVFLVGAYCDFRLDYGRVIPRRAKIVAINRSEFHLKRNTDLFWTPTIAAKADPAIFMLQLIDRATSSSWFPAARPGWVSFAADLKKGEVVKEEANAIKAQQEAFGRVEIGPDGRKHRRKLLNPLQLVGALEKVLGDKSILIGDGGDFIATAAYVLRPRGPLTWLDPGAFGTLGVGGGFALGAKLCRPDHDVWLLWGDGSVGYSVAEYDTFKRHDVNIISLIGNDSCWTQIEREQIPMFGSDIACPLLYTRYDLVATNYGGDGLVIEDPEADLEGILRSAQVKARRGTPMCVNALIGKSDFRKGSLSV